MLGCSDKPHKLRVRHWSPVRFDSCRRGNTHWRYEDKFTSKCLGVPGRQAAGRFRAFKLRLRRCRLLLSVAHYASNLHSMLQAKRDEAYLEEYRKQAHAALLKDPYSTSFSEDPEIVHKNPIIKSVIKYNHQSPGDGSAFSSSSQVDLPYF